MRPRVFFFKSSTCKFCAMVESEIFLKLIGEMEFELITIDVQSSSSEEMGWWENHCMNQYGEGRVPIVKIGRFIIRWDGEDEQNLQEGLSELRENIMRAIQTVSKKPEPVPFQEKVFATVAAT